MLIDIDFLNVMRGKKCVGKAGFCLRWSKTVDANEKCKGRGNEKG